MKKLTIPFFFFFLAACVMVTASCHKHHSPEETGTVLGPANCFVISAPGTYSFRVVKGNSTESVGAVTSTDVLWESFGTNETPAKGSIVSKVDYLAKENLVRFKTPAALKDGNALVAVRDASGKILWSWHIWVCKGWDPAKTAHTYYNNAGIMMDRNLGATSVTPGDVRTFGLLYQWGRKDPFLGSCRLTEKTETAASTLTWPEHVPSTAQTGTIEYAINHPTTFITSNEANYDWYYSEVYDTDNTRWQEKKTIYDPCPEGWVLPTGPTPNDAGFWFKVYGKHIMALDLDKKNRGRNFTKVFGDADPIWYPLTGFKADDDGVLWAVGDRSDIWTCTPDLDEGDPNAKVMAFALNLEAITDHTELSVFTAIDDCRGIGFSVRCVAEKTR